MNMAELPATSIAPEAGRLLRQSPAGVRARATGRKFYARPAGPRRRTTPGSPPDCDPGAGAGSLLGGGSRNESTLERWTERTTPPDDVPRSTSCVRVQQVETRGGR